MKNEDMNIVKTLQKMIAYLVENNKEIKKKKRKDLKKFFGDFLTENRY